MWKSDIVLACPVFSWIIHDLDTCPHKHSSVFDRNDQVNFLLSEYAWGISFMLDFMLNEIRIIKMCTKGTQSKEVFLLYPHFSLLNTSVK